MQLLQSGGWCILVSLFNTVHCLPMFLPCQPLPRKGLLNTRSPPLWDLKAWVKGTVENARIVLKRKIAKHGCNSLELLFLQRYMWYCSLVHGQLQAFEPYDILSTAVQLNLNKCSVEFSGKAVQDYVTWRVFIWGFFCFCLTALL